MKIAKNIVTVLLAVLIGLSVPLGIIVFSVRSEIGNTSLLTVKIAEDDYFELVSDRVSETVKRKLALVVITPEQLSEFFTAQALRDDALDALSATIRCAFGKDYETYSYKNDDLCAEIERILLEYSEENGVEFADGSTDKVYSMLCDAVTEELRVVPEKYANQAAKLSARVEKLCSFYYIFPVIYVVAAAAIVVLGRKRIANALYNVFLPSYLGAFAAYAVSAIMLGKDYLANTILKNEAFQYILHNLYRFVFSDMRQGAATLVITFAAASLVVIARIAVGTKHRHSHGTKE